MHVYVRTDRGEWRGGGGLLPVEIMLLTSQWPLGTQMDASRKDKEFIIIILYRII